MIKITDKSKCCGCSACYNICPKNAIEMVEDENGFKYPVVDKEKCINCGLCEKVCPIINQKKVNNEPVAYACINKDERIRQESSSGGIFSLLAEFVLDKGGKVFGAAFDNEFNLEHIYIEKKEELYKLRTSKYLQSNIGNTFRKVKEFLDSEKLVLFTGTPCQIEGLKAFLKKDYDNLITQDFICHGVPSPKVWRKYREYRKNTDRRSPKNINFRDKDKGWHTFSLRFDYDNKAYSKTQNQDVFMKAFLSNLCLRDSCYNCKFKKYNRISDITLADFWGIEHINKKLDDNKGVSLVIVNSQKGQKIFDIIKERCIFESVNIDDAIKYNPSFTSSVNMNKKRKEFFERIDYENFQKLVNELNPKPNIIKRVYYKLKNIIKKIKTQ